MKILDYFQLGGKGVGRLDQVGAALTLVEQWIGQHVDEAFIKTRADDFLGSIGKSVRVVLRLRNRLDARHDTEIEDDLFVCGRDLLLLKLMLAWSAGFEKARIGEDEPEIARLNALDESSLALEYEEALNRIDHYYAKYPH